MRNNSIAIIVALLFCFQYSFAQNAISVDFLKDQTAASIEAEFGIPAEYDIEYYSMTYTTLGSDMQLDTASGLLIIPKDPALQFPMLTYQHGTVQDRNTGMSNLVAADVDLASIYGSFGFITVAPDYIGMVESRGFHPYVHADTEASAALDMMRAARDILPSINSYWNERTFITGYSQGGHAAMALHREIETNHPEEFDIIVSFPMSGPYSISEKMIEFTLGDSEYFFVAYLPNVALSFKTVYPDLLADIELEDIFKAEYIADIRKFENEEIDLFELNTALINRLVQTGGASIPKNMMHDSMVTILKTDPTHPLSMALADNDVYDWSPKALTRLFYCKGDDQVTYENAILAQEVMTQNGSTVVEALNMSDTEDHGGCVFPAINSALNLVFFFRGITTSTSDLLDATQLAVSPNPADQMIKIELDRQLKLQDATYKVLDHNGRVVVEGRLDNHSTTVNIASLPSGMFVIDIESSTFKGLKRIIKN